jgi:hypothetical protein
VESAFVSKLALAILAIMLLPVPATAQSAFDGTWKIELSTTPASNPDVWLVQDGIYRCESCAPPIKVKVDGRDQRVTGQPYDTISVKIVDARTIKEVEKKGGKIVSDETFTVSPDGNTVTDEFPNGEKQDGVPEYTKFIFTRIAKGAPGSHLISGSWRMSKLENVADEFLLMTLKVQDGSLEMSRPTGQSFKAKLGGTDAPYKGDPNINFVSVNLLNKNSIEEIDKHDGKTLRLTTMTVAPDGRTMSIESADLPTGARTRYAADKQ